MVLSELCSVALDAYATNECIVPCTKAMLFLTKLDAFVMMDSYGASSTFFSSQFNSRCHNYSPKKMTRRRDTKQSRCASQSPMRANSAQGPLSPMYCATYDGIMFQHFQHPPFHTLQGPRHPSFSTLPINAKMILCSHLYIPQPGIT
jgi:hypothetical protein